MNVTRMSFGTACLRRLGREAIVRPRSYQMPYDYHPPKEGDLSQLP